MQYKCIKKIPGHGLFNLFGGYFLGETIDIETYKKLPVEKQGCFEVNYEDESLADQIAHNLENDNDE